MQCFLEDRNDNGKREIQRRGQKWRDTHTFTSFSTPTCQGENRLIFLFPTLKKIWHQYPVGKIFKWSKKTCIKLYIALLFHLCCTCRVFILCAFVLVAMSFVLWSFALFFVFLFSRCDILRNLDLKFHSKTGQFYKVYKHRENNLIKTSKK